MWSAIVVVAVLTSGILFRSAIHRHKARERRSMRLYLSRIQGDAGE